MKSCTDANELIKVSLVFDWQSAFESGLNKPSAMTRMNLEKQGLCVVK